MTAATVDPLDEITCLATDGGDGELVRAAHRHARARRWDLKDVRAFLRACLWLRDALQATPDHGITDRRREPDVTSGQGHSRRRHFGTCRSGTARLVLAAEDRGVQE